MHEHLLIDKVQQTITTTPLPTRRIGVPPLLVDLPTARAPIELKPNAVFLTRGDRIRAVVITAAALATAVTGIALASGGHPIGIGMWIVFTPLVAGTVWSALGRRRAADYRAMFLFRALGAGAAIVIATLGLLMAGSAAMLGLVLLIALGCALAAIAAHRELPFERDMAHRGF